MTVPRMFYKLFKIVKHPQKKSESLSSSRRKKKKKAWCVFYSETVAVYTTLVKFIKDKKKPNSVIIIYIQSK